MIFCAAVTLQGATNDMLLLPAEKSERAPFSTLMDVQRVDGRMWVVGERGHILYSDDECSGWIQVEVPVSVTLTAVYFPSYDNGWAVGHEGVVLHTEDGGKTWTKQLDGYKLNELMVTKLKQMIQAKTKLLEDMEAEPGEDQPEALEEDKETGLDEDQREALEVEIEDLEYFLSDWELASKEGPTLPLMDVWFKNDREGMVVGAFGIILGTEDGGETWKPLLDRIHNIDGFHYYGITRSGDDLFVAGEAGILYRSEDFGQSWQQLESPYEGSYFGIISDPAGGFITAFGLRGHIYYSLDRGETWVPSKTGSRASLSGGAFLSDGSFCVVGVDGAVLRSTDRGKTFTALPKRWPGGIAVAEMKRDVLVVVGMRGVTRMEINKPSSENKG